MSRTLGQQRASFCLKQLEDLKCKRDEFKNFSAGLPAMIMQNGFGQTLAFLVAKGEDKHWAAFDIIADWLKECNLLDGGNRLQILNQISDMKQDRYLYAQQESLAMLEWLKRYANASLFAEEANS